MRQSAAATLESVLTCAPEVCLHDETARGTWRKRSTGNVCPARARGGGRDHGGLPQMMVAVSAEPEFGAVRSLTSAYKYCDREIVSAPMERMKREAMRRLP